MKQRMDAVQKVEDVLVQAHRRSRQAEVGPFFQQGVMGRVIEESRAAAVSLSNGLYAGRAAWRLALVSYLVVIVLFAQLMTSDPESQLLLSMLMLDDSSSLDLLGTFGVL